MQAGSSLGFDLFSSLAAIDAWADDEDSDVEEEVDGNISRQSNDDKERWDAVAEEIHLSKAGYDECVRDRDRPQSLLRNPLTEGFIKRTGVNCTRSTGTYRVNFAKDFATKILSKDIIQHMVSYV